MSCYSLLQHSRLAWLALFVDHTHTHSVNNLRCNCIDSPDWHHFRESHVTDGESETAVSASLQKIKLIKNQHIKYKKSPFFIWFNLKLVTHLSIISMVILHTWKPWTFPLMLFVRICWGGVVCFFVVFFFVLGGGYFLGLLVSSYFFFS